jgi:hypothetical protein
MEFRRTNREIVFEPQVQPDNLQAFGKVAYVGVPPFPFGVKELGIARHEDIAECVGVSLQIREMSGHVLRSWIACASDSDHQNRFFDPLAGMHRHKNTGSIRSNYARLGRTVFVRSRFNLESPNGTWISVGNSDGVQSRQLPDQCQPRTIFGRQGIDVRAVDRDAEMSTLLSLLKRRVVTRQ